MSTKVETKETVQKRGCFLLLGPPVVLLTFSSVLIGTVLTDLIVNRTCLVSLNTNITDCLMLRKNSSSPGSMDLEKRIEPYASVILMTQTLIENILPGVLALFLGPWSDLGGRRPLFLAAFGGYTSKFGILCLMSIWNISPWYLLLALIPANLVGGSCALRLAVTCYISDTTSEKDRRVQLTLLEASISAGIILGALAGRLIYENYGYTATFGTAAFCNAIALVYVYHLIPESVKDTSKGSIRNIFKMKFVKFMAVKPSTKQSNSPGSVVFLAIFTLTLNSLITKGHQTTEFLFTRARLGWGVQYYSDFMAVTTVIRIAGLCVVSLRGRISGTSDTLITGIALMSALGGAITKSLAWETWHMYLALCIEIFSGITGPVLRSVISKFVPAQDVGKIFSLIALLELLSSLAGTPLYTLIYSHYLPPKYPSPVYLLSVSFFTLLILCVTCMEMLIRKSRDPPIYMAAAQEDL